jgi:TIR domain
MAPMGWQVGSDEWWRHVRQEIELSSACIAFFSEMAKSDNLFLARCDEAAAKRILVPTLLDDIPIESLPSRFVGSFQFGGFYTKGNIADTAGRIAHYLPREERQVMCFISYSRDDTKIVQNIEEQLLNAGISTWRDAKNIGAGAAWDSSIEQAIIGANHVLAVVSAKSITSQNVADEIEFARERKKIIIPLLLDDSPLPMRMHRSQAIDLRTNLSINVLIEQIRAYKKNSNDKSNKPSSISQRIEKSSYLGRLRAFFRRF